MPAKTRRQTQANDAVFYVTPSLSTVGDRAFTGGRSGTPQGVNTRECESISRAKIAVEAYGRRLVCGPSAWSTMYHPSVVRRLEANPSVDVRNPTMTKHGLVRQPDVATQQPFSWRGVVHEARVEVDKTCVRSAPDGHTCPDWPSLNVAGCAVLRDQGLTRRTVVTRGFWRIDAPAKQTGR